MESQYTWSFRRKEMGGSSTKYQPVGLSRFPNLLWEVRTKRTFG